MLCTPSWCLLVSNGSDLGCHGSAFNAGPVSAQANVSRKKAVKALKTADGDIVSAIMELTM